MICLIDKNRSQFLREILLAVSQAEVEKLMNTILPSMKRPDADEKATVMFCLQLAADLGHFSPLKKDARQWSNIKLAKILVNRINNHLAASVQQAVHV